MPDVPQILLYSAAAFGISVLWNEFTKMIINLRSEDKGKKEAVSSGEDSSYIYTIDEEGEGCSDDKRRLVMRKFKVQKKN